MAFILTSPVFAAERTIPAAYTCEGDEISPPLQWSGAPDGTQSFALIVDDPDAPDPAAPKMTYVHWVLFNIPATVTALAEGVKTLPAGTREGVSDEGTTGYVGPCPPIGTHRYYHKLYALDCVLDLQGTPTKAQLLKAMEGHVLGQATLMGVYKKRG